MFERLNWLPDRLVLDDLVLRLEHTKSDGWDGGDHLMFYKVQGLIDQYEWFFNSFPEFHPQYVLELGMWDGGSTLFWNELLKPQQIAGIDIRDRQDSPLFEKYVESRGLSGRVVTHWKTNQADKERLRQIVASDFESPVDFVIDDCSHLYDPTKASFEALFPLLAPGGWYIIEDWAWGHWPNYQTEQHPWFGKKPLTEFVIDLVKALGSDPNAIPTIYILPGFVAVRRGSAHIDQPDNYILDDHIVTSSFGSPKARRAARSAGPASRSMKDFFSYWGLRVKNKALRMLRGKR